MSNWYKDAIIYELHVRAFFDSNNDGIGDFKGLTKKLNYLCDLGVNTLWLLPFYPSPLKDDGYDIANYLGIHPSYGTLRDFKNFLTKAHQLGIRVITELVVNHTSDQHEWFQKSRLAKPGSYWRDFYVWSDDSKRYSDARIIFRDFETSNWAWDTEAKAYYWHRFYAHQPDLNFDNPNVQKAILKVADFWLSLGVDGMRLDAVPYLFERENTSCENLPETHAFLKSLRAHVDKKFPERLLLAEANQWPEDAVAYFGDGDECHMCFHFPLMPRLFMALQNEDSHAIVDILKQTPEIPDNCQWAMFLRNHDELTLEMVTDEERDSLYRAYAPNPRARINLGIRRRLAPLLGNDRRQIELLFSILFSLPGAPVVYYGDEIGMGDNINLGDRDGVRTPFHWNGEKNAGFSKADPTQLYLPIHTAPEYHYEANNAEAQQHNQSSLLGWLKSLIAHRKAHSALSRGTLEILTPKNPHVLAFTRSHEDRVYLFVANLSKRVQCVEIDLTQHRRRVPVEISNQTDFPPITDAPYILTMGSHGTYWFELEERRALELTPIPWQEPALAIGMRGIDSLLDDLRSRHLLERRLTSHLPKMRWFGAKHREIRRCVIKDWVHLPGLQEVDGSCLLVIEVHFSEGETSLFLVPLSLVRGDDALAHDIDQPEKVLLRFQDGALYDALLDDRFGSTLMEVLLKQQKVKTQQGTLKFSLEQPLNKDRHGLAGAWAPLGQDQSNSSLVLNQRVHLKLFRKLEPGENPDVEIGRFLSKTSAFSHAPKLIGSIDYVTPRHHFTLGLAQDYIANETNAWNLMLNQLDSFANLALAQVPQSLGSSLLSKRSFDLLKQDPPESVFAISKDAFALSKLLGERTAHLHQALATSNGNDNFSPEEFTPFSLRALHQSLRNASNRSLKLLESKLSHIDPVAQSLAEEVLDRTDAIESVLAQVRSLRSGALRIRCHGDLHLGQVLFTGDDFCFVDFEGEPKKAIGERRLKRSPLRDVASMMRSFDYVAHFYLQEKLERPNDREALKAWFGAWSTWSSMEYLKGYQAHAQGSSFFPSDDADAAKLMHAFILEKALYELHYELSNRPELVRIALKGILEQVP